VFAVVVFPLSRNRIRPAAATTAVRSFRFLLLYNTKEEEGRYRRRILFLASLNVINEATMTHSGSIAVTGCADRGSARESERERERRAVMHNCRFSLTLFALASIVDERLGRFSLSALLQSQVFYIFIFYFGEGVWVRME
jgi:hypothetical protein